MVPVWVTNACLIFNVQYINNNNTIHLAVTYALKSDWNDNI